jgi:FkbH-like protein
MGLIAMSNSKESHLDLDAPVNEDIIESLFELILCRPVGNTEIVRQLVDQRKSVRDFIRDIRNSDECLTLASKEMKEKKKNQEELNDLLSNSIHYRAPKKLAINRTLITKILGIGTCFMESQISATRAKNRELSADIYLIGNPLPDLPASPIAEYQFQIVQLGLRFVLPDFSFAKLSQDDLAGHIDLFEFAKAGITRLLNSAMKWNRAHGILSFVMSFPVPQQNLVGRLFTRYDLRNPVYFVESLNKWLFENVDKYRHAYFIDINEIAGSLGRRFSFEDEIMAFNHGGLAGDFDYNLDRNRLDKIERISNIYEKQSDILSIAIWNEILAMYRTINQIDSVKLIVIDLDDTLWRGVVGDTEVDALPTSEGWPRGFWEALLVLKRRGVLLAIISKNEESRVRDVWKQILGNGGLTLEDFAIVRINWQQKSENMSEILREVNILPRSVVYIDDNPAQRDDIKRNFPDIRVLGGTPNIWRHVLLWAPETQVSTITPESTKRTQMIQAQVQREEERISQSGQEFLFSLQLKMKIYSVFNIEHPRFSRIFELVNKTNQFNTTGQRWNLEEFISAFAKGMRIIAFEVSDRFTEYGLVGVLLIDKACIRQFVMSCRVMSLDAELAAIAYASKLIVEMGTKQIFADLVHTDRNAPCRDVYHRSGFENIDGIWICKSDKISQIPRYIDLVVED